MNQQIVECTQAAGIIERSTSSQELLQELGTDEVIILQSICNGADQISRQSREEIMLESNSTKDVHELQSVDAMIQESLKSLNDDDDSEMDCNNGQPDVESEHDEKTSESLASSQCQVQER